MVGNTNQEEMKEMMERLESLEAMAKQLGELVGGEDDWSPDTIEGVAEILLDYGVTKFEDGWMVTA